MMFSSPFLNVKYSQNIVSHSETTCTTVHFLLAHLCMVSHTYFMTRSKTLQSTKIMEDYMDEFLGKDAILSTDATNSKDARNRKDAGKITLHCSQYTKVYTVIDGRIDTVSAYKLGKRFTAYLVPEPISRLMYAKALDFVDHVTTANIEQRITIKD